MILEWDVPFVLIPSVGAAGTAPALPQLPLNQLVTLGSADLGWYLLDPSKCQSGAARRLTRANLAQADGEITRKKFKAGYVIELNAQLWERPGVGQDAGLGQPACAGVLRQMGDTLAEYLGAIFNNDGMLVWQPSGWPDPNVLPNPRVLDKCRSMGPSGSGDSGFVSVISNKDPAGPLVDVTFALLSPFPYVTDYMNWPTSADEVTVLTGGGGTVTATITNEGSAFYSPIIQVYGPCDGFSITNLDLQDDVGNDLEIVYDDTLPGAFPIASGQYVEIDTFRSTAIVHYAGGGTANAKRCIDAQVTDYFQLAPGANHLQLTYYGGPGAQAQVVWRNAWE
jgi:hypothetical protein